MILDLKAAKEPRQLTSPLAWIFVQVGGQNKPIHVVPSEADFAREAQAYQMFPQQRDEPFSSFREPMALGRVRTFLKLKLLFP